jgi:serine/threonine protein kinase
MMNPDEAERLAEDLAEDYFDRLRQGETPDRAALLAAHPKIGALLERQLAFGELMRRAAEEQKGSAGREPPHGGQALVDTDFVSPNATAPAHPERIGRYVIREHLGQGASGTVYRAYDPKFDREVALKVLRSDRASGAEFADRFEREARIAAQLRYPHLVPVHETGAHAGERYIDMELVRGETLEARLKRAPMKPREAAELVRKLAAALNYAHGLGIVHRDVKPSNIVIDKRGEPQLTDFGLARRAGAEATLTETGQIIGTVAYMSPEQAEGGAPGTRMAAAMATAWAWCCIACSPAGCRSRRRSR